MKTLIILAVTAMIVPFVAGAQRKPVDRTVVAIPLAPPIPGAQALVAWHTESIRCGDRDLPDTGVMLPRLTFGWLQPGAQARVTFDFAVDGEGRPIDIRRTADTTYILNADDLAPALGASNLRQARRSVIAGSTMSARAHRSRRRMCPT